MVPRVLFSLLFFFSLTISFGQKSFRFSNDTANFPNEVISLIGANISESDELIVNEFRTNWNTDFFSLQEKGMVVDVSRVWLEKKATGIQFVTFIEFLLVTKKSDNSRDLLIPILNFFKRYIAERRTTLNASNNLLYTIGYLITGKYLYYSNATQWKYSGEAFELVTDTSKLYFRFKKVNLTCYSKHDSIVLFETSGLFSPIENKWRGNGGFVTWERAGYKPEDVKANLKLYTLEFNKNEYSADSTILYYGKYFSTPILGKLTDKVMQITDKEKASYPEFDSYSKRFLIKDLYENLDYDGGFTLRGARIIGSGNEREDAKIIVKRSDKILMEVRSKYFVFRPDRVNGLNSTIKINIERDSIYHSDQNFIYYPAKNEVNLVRSDNYSSKSPYYNSYHKVDMEFEQLTWRINQPKISFTMARGSTIGRSRFESQSFYNQERFDKLQGREDVHPLVQLFKFAKKNYNDEFTAAAFADYVGRPIEQVRQLLMYIAENGFIYYYSGNDVVKIKQRLYDFLNASGGKVDFDVVDFASLVNAPLDNAVLDMETFDLTINGMPRVMVSDSQNVAIYPDREQIILKQNRSFQFDGTVDAGLFTFRGHNFFFNYDEFKINLQNVDVVAVRVFTGEIDNFGKPVTRDLKNAIHHITGDLRIDKPDNKSGRKNYAAYPLFESRGNSHVYYQDPSIEGGVYPEESFYFELDPFLLDSLDNFSTQGLEFTGKFYSSDILPVIDQKLSVRPDFSLGFTHDPGPGGIPVYTGKGNLYGGIDMSNNGLRAKGKLTYLTSTTLSNDFKFYPDSMNTQSVDFTIARQISGTQYPSVDSKNNYIHWNTRFDEMRIHQGSAPFKMFNPETTLAGTLVLEPKGLSGMGKMDLTTADLYSKLYTYKAEVIDADTLSFNLKSLHNKGFTVQTSNVKSHIDFTTRNGDFTSNEDFSLVTFPENQYISYLDYFKWNMNNKTLEMGAKRLSAKTKTGIAGKESEAKTGAYDRFSFKEEPIGPRYISVHPKQDSLNFVAPLAVYDYEKNLLNASNVKLIRVADAIVYPKDGKVTINADAQMKTIYKTKVVAGYENRYHTIHTADVNIFGRFSFTGAGIYDYLDERDSIQEVFMKDIKVDTGKHTIISGIILEQDTFNMSPDFSYQGNLILNSTRQLPAFDGGVTMRTECSKPLFKWLKFNSEIDAKNIFIPISDKPVSINNEKIYNGIFIANDSIHVYPSFISSKRNYNDKFITTSSGFLRYNKDSSVFEIASMDKLQNRNLPGSYLSYHKFNCIEYGEGKIDLGVNLGQMKLNSFGSASFNTLNKQVDLTVMLGIDFMLDANAVKLMSNKIDSFPDLKALDITAPVYVKIQNDVLGREKAEKYREEITLNGETKVMPPAMLHTLNLTYLRLRWNHATRSYQSVGKIGIGNILTNHINKMVDGFIEISKRRSGDYMDIYLKLDSKNFYYFGYTRGVMQTYSSDNNYVTLIRDLTINQRQMNVPRGETSYIYMVSSDTRMQNFIRSYQLYQRGEAMEEIPIEPDLETEQENIQQPDSLAEPVPVPVPVPVLEDSIAPAKEVSTEPKDALPKQEEIVPNQDTIPKKEEILKKEDIIEVQ